MKNETPTVTYRKDYTPTEYLISKVDITFELDATATKVTARSKLMRNSAFQNPVGTLVLDGNDLKLLSVSVDGESLEESQYTVSEQGLELSDLPESFALEIVTEINPTENTSCMGLYKSGSTYCTQMEAEGFRRVTYFLDRPDVLSVYTTTIIANGSEFPILLSNGNRISSERIEDGRTKVVWNDPFPKPCYLFALVAGDLGKVVDSFTTKSGREIALEIYVDKGNEARCAHAMDSLKRSMRWDEEVFGLEYDLDIFMLVAVDTFNFGAMENKGLNIFNSLYVLADPDIATDRDYLAIEGVVAHEYFHNWTGNRVTCRDWFQLTLKEGLTVFRDQEFSGDMNSRPVQRIMDVKTLRERQFPEDSGPNAHPIRPESFIEIDNFYTPTIYEKGAEVIRMIHTLIGAEKFRRGIDTYFELFDGQAVTTDDFVHAMSKASGYDFSKFLHWYSQAGTPHVVIQGEYDAGSKRYKLEVRQELPETPDGAEKLPYEFPLALGLISEDGRELSFVHDGVEESSAKLIVSDAVQSFTLENVAEKPIPSLFRHFSAPITFDFEYSDSDLITLLKSDTDPFNRFDSSQRLAMRYLLRFVEDLRNSREVELPAELHVAYRGLISEKSWRADPALVAEALIVPTESAIIESLPIAYIQEVCEARKLFRESVAKGLQGELLPLYEVLKRETSGEYKPTSEAMAARKLKNAVLGYLSLIDSEQVESQFYDANNMTDQFSAFVLLCKRPELERAEYVNHFYNQWKAHSRVIDKWLAAQASSPAECTLDVVQALEAHEAFSEKNPNRVRSLYGAFGSNFLNFHRKDGAGYKFLAGKVIRIDSLNPKLGAGLAKLFARYRKLPQESKELMGAELGRILSTEGLSKGTYEIVSKTLGK